MALHLDLHHEILQQERERQRDPLKLGIFFLAFVAVCCLGFYLMHYNRVRVLRGELARIRAEWTTLEAEQKQAEVKEAELLEARSLADTLQASINSRFFWAPFLELLGEVVPINVQVSRMSASVVEKANRLTVNLDGLAAGDAPRQVAETFRLGLESKLCERFTAADASFRSLDDSSATAELGGRELEIVQFSITVDVDVDKVENANGAKLPDRRLTAVSEESEP